MSAIRSFPSGQANHTDALLQQAAAAARQDRHVEARRLLETVLRHDPNNAQALLLSIYVAENGQASLSCLGRLLDAHPSHPQARETIRWVRRRIPTSIPVTASRRPPSRSFRFAPRVISVSRRWIYALALLALLIGLGAAWQLSQPETVSVRANVLRETPAPVARSVLDVINMVIPLFTPTAPPTPTPTATPVLVSAWVPVLGQPQSRNLSCESRSVADLSSYWGVPVDELEFLSALGQSDNPHKGFVGDVDQSPGSLPPYGYGVYAEPVAATLRTYGLDAHPVYDLGLEGLKAELLAGRPVMVWATYGMEPHKPVEWLSNDGQVSTVVPFMHTFLITGFDADGLFVLDAYDSTVQHYPAEVFVNIWNVFDQMAVTVTGPLP